jgi:hypothetical protein
MHAPTSQPFSRGGEMSQQAQMRNGRAPMTRARGELTSRARYRRSQALARNGPGELADRPHPLEFDESGFPIAQRSGGFVERVARLLSPD